MSGKLLFLSIFVFCNAILLSQSDFIPVDKNVKIGKLANGLTYYIRVNKKPEKRAELRLVVNAGSVLENEDQRGLAHFVEHMAFNGSKKYKKNELINFLESLGMHFGPEINAYTSFDETVYKLTVPTDQSKILEKSFAILEDWAHGLTFDSVEVEKERGVVIEEWRAGRGAGERMQNKQFPVLLKDSKYASRIPIGEIEIIKNFQHHTLKQFYTDWYRPDLMAIVAVGDFNPNTIEKLISKYFGKIKSNKKSPKRSLYNVPPHSETLFAIATDKEAAFSSVTMVIKDDLRQIRTIKDYKENLIRSICFAMLNERFAEIRKKTDAPFINAVGSYSQILRTASAAMITASVKEDKVLPALQSLYTEARRVAQYGYTDGELQRTKAEFQRSIEKALAEFDKTESTRYINAYVANYLSGLPIPGIQNTAKLYAQILPEIAIEEVNTAIQRVLQEQNRVILVNMPEKENVPVPTTQDLQNALLKAKSEELAAFVDKVKNEPLIPIKPVAGNIISNKHNAAFDLHEWKLSNGARVLFKNTNFKNDEILMQAFSPGGNSILDDSDVFNGKIAAELAASSGLGNFDPTELRKALTGKYARIAPYIANLHEGFSGMSTTKDFESFFELLHLYFSKPRFDSSAFAVLLNNYKTWLQNRSNDPRSALEDTLTNTLNSYHPRYRLVNDSDLAKTSLDKAQALFKGRFGDADGFTFVFVGNIDSVKLREYVEKYIASLPSGNKKETWKLLGSNYPAGIIRKEIFKGIEPKSEVVMVFHGNAAFDRKKEFEFETLMSILSIKLREVIREEISGTYGISIDGGFLNKENEFHVQIGFGCSPERVEELIKSVYAVLDTVKLTGVDSLTIDKVREQQRKSRETSIKKNDFWLRLLTDYIIFDDDLMLINDYDLWVDTMNSSRIKELANLYLPQNEIVTVVLYPETYKKDVK